MEIKIDKINIKRSYIKKSLKLLKVINQKRWFRFFIYKRCNQKTRNIK